MSRRVAAIIEKAGGVGTGDPTVVMSNDSL